LTTPPSIAAPILDPIGREVLCPIAGFNHDERVLEEGLQGGSDLPADPRH
jgi:hypothetical protein